jgi:hypothetical protein
VGFIVTTDWKKVAADAWDSPGWKTAAREYREPRAGRRAVVEIDPERAAMFRRLMDSNVSLERAWYELNQNRRSTQQTVIEAIMVAVRARGIEALKEPETKERLERCDTDALAEIERRIVKLRKA